MPAKRTTIIDKSAVAQTLKLISQRTNRFQNSERLRSFEKIHLYASRRLVAPLEVLVIIKQEAISLGIDCDWYLDTDGAPNDHPNFFAKSFTASFDLDSSAARRSIRDYAGKYLHFALSPDDKSAIISRCSLLRGAWEDKLPAYEMRRRVDGEERVYLGGYYKNDNEIFMIGSKKHVPDLRLCIFSSFENDFKFMRGVMTGVSMKKMIFSTPCCMVRLPDTDEPCIIGGSPLDTERHYEITELKEDDWKRVFDFLDPFSRRSRPCLMIAPTGIDI